jgi:uncharacterized membrane protein
VSAVVKLISGLILFHGIHLLPTRPAWRASLVSRLGNKAYLVIFSALSVLGFGLIIYGYGEARGLARANPQLWLPPTWGRHVALLLMLPAMILLVASNVPSRIRDWARHPMLAAIMLWALAHLLVRADLASALLFGSFLAYVIYDRVSVGQRAALGPLGTRTGGLRNDLMVLVLGVSAYGLFAIVLHGWLFGVTPIRLNLAP